MEVQRGSYYGCGTVRKLKRKVFNEKSDPEKRTETGQKR